MKIIFMMTTIFMLVTFGLYHYHIPVTGIKIQNGCTYKMVEDLLGTPGKLEHQDKMIKWVYTFAEEKRILFFENGKVVISYHRKL